MEPVPRDKLDRHHVEGDAYQSSTILEQVNKVHSYMIIMVMAEWTTTDDYMGGHLSATLEHFICSYFQLNTNIIINFLYIVIMCTTSLVEITYLCITYFDLAA